MSSRKRKVLTLQESRIYRDVPIVDSPVHYPRAKYVGVAAARDTDERPPLYYILTDLGVVVNAKDYCINLPEGVIALKS